MKLPLSSFTTPKAWTCYWFFCSYTNDVIYSKKRLVTWFFINNLLLLKFRGVKEKQKKQNNGNLTKPSCKGKEEKTSKPKYHHIPHYLMKAVMDMEGKGRDKVSECCHLSGRHESIVGYPHKSFWIPSALHAGCTRPLRESILNTTWRILASFVRGLSLTSLGWKFWLFGWVATGTTPHFSPYCEWRKVSKYPKAEGPSGTADRRSFIFSFNLSVLVTGKSCTYFFQLFVDCLWTGGIPETTVPAWQRCTYWHYKHTKGMLLIFWPQLTRRDNHCMVSFIMTCKISVLWLRSISWR